jgi:signal transduction histidine kinase
MPSERKSSSVFVIRIDDNSILQLEKDPLRLRVDSKKRPYLSVATMTKAVSILANSEAKAIAVLMPEYAFPATDIDMNELTTIVKYDQRIVIGTVGYNQPQPNLSKLPPVLAQIEDQVAGYETFRSRSNAIVRTLPYTNYRGLSETESLQVKIAEKADSSFASRYGSYSLKPLAPENFESIGLADFLADSRYWLNTIKNKVVVLGYTVPRDAGFQTTDPMFVHTPLTGFSPTLDNGISTTWLTANAIDNLLENDTIRKAPEVINLIQTIGVALLCGLFWEWGSLAGSLATIFCWILLLSIHSATYRWFSVSIPLADTFLVTTLIVVLAAIKSLRSELKFMAEQKAKTDAKSQIAHVQSHFLSGFATWLKSMTTKIVMLIKSSEDKEKSTQTSLHSNNGGAHELYYRAFAAAEDFNEYLEAINQIPELESARQRSLTKEETDIQKLVETVLKRFSVKIESGKILISVDIPPDAAKVKTNPQLLDAIIFNLIGNAIKYGSSGGLITIRSTRGKNNTIRISVIDQGPGIPKELQERIFERFYRIRDDRMYQAKGTGLGLFLCRYFAEHLGGMVDVESEEGSGSEFSVVLPA